MRIAVTGHRPDKLGGYSDIAFYNLISIFQLYIDTLPRDKPVHILTGMALGWDQAVAHACASRMISFTACLPCNEQSKMWPDSSKERYMTLLGYANKTVIVTPGTYKHSVMQTRNEYMVNNCDLLVAMWDGSPGGTNNCVKYAKKLNKPIVNLYPSYINFNPNNPQLITP